jgi:hypothetical protein
VWLTVEDALLEHLAKLGRAELLVPLAGGGRHRHGIGDLAHHHHGETVHVEGQRGRGVALRQLLGDQTIRLVARPQPAIPLRDTEAEKPLRAQIRIVVERKRSLAIMRRGPRRKPLERQPPRRTDQLLLAGRRFEIHSGFIGDSSSGDIE